MLAGFLLLTWGVIFIVAGAMVLWLGTVAEAISSLTLSAEAMDIVADLDKQPNAFAGIVIILGIMQTIGAIGILAHRAWGRAFGVVLGLLGTIAGIGMILSAIDLNVGDFAIRGTLAERPARPGLRHPRGHLLRLHLPGHVRGQAPLPEEGRQLTRFSPPR